jgi:hypothetical protein
VNPVLRIDFKSPVPPVGFASTLMQNFMIIPAKNITMASLYSIALHRHHLPPETLAPVAVCFTRTGPTGRHPPDSSSATLHVMKYDMTICTLSSSELLSQMLITLASNKVLHKQPQSLDGWDNIYSQFRASSHEIWEVCKSTPHMLCRVWVVSQPIQVLLAFLIEKECRH